MTPPPSLSLGPRTRRHFGHPQFVPHFRRISSAKRVLTLSQPSFRMTACRHWYCGPPLCLDSPTNLIVGWFVLITNINNEIFFHNVIITCVGVYIYIIVEFLYCFNWNWELFLFLKISSDSIGSLIFVFTDLEFYLENFVIFKRCSNLI